MTYDTTFGHDINLNPGRVTPCQGFQVSISVKVSIEKYKLWVISSSGAFRTSQELVVLASDVMVHPKEHHGEGIPNKTSVSIS